MICSSGPRPAAGCVITQRGVCPTSEQKRGKAERERERERESPAFVRHDGGSRCRRATLNTNPNLLPRFRPLPLTCLKAIHTIPTYNRILLVTPVNEAIVVVKITLPTADFLPFEQTKPTTGLNPSRDGLSGYERRPRPAVQLAQLDRLPARFVAAALLCRRRPLLLTSGAEAVSRPDVHGPTTKQTQPTASAEHV